MYADRIAKLEEYHRDLDHRIAEMQKRGNFDDNTLNELKKKKLQYKDEISKLRKLDWEERHERVDFDDDR